MTAKQAKETARLAWWAWLTCRDASLAQRLRDLCGGSPPWLDPLAWASLGAAAGFLLGWLAQDVIWPINIGLTWQRDVLVLSLTLYSAAVFAAREESETPADFPRRVAAWLLHLPAVAVGFAAYLVICQWVAQGIGLRVVAGREGLSAGFGPVAVGLGFLLLAGLLLTTPSVFQRRDDRWDVSGWSFILRIVPIGFYGCTLIWQELRFLDEMRIAYDFPAAIFAAYPIADGLKEAAVGLLLLLITFPWQERAAVRFVGWATGWRGARARVWPDWLAPVPLSLERLLLATEREHDWRLGADYLVARGYPPRLLHAAGATRPAVSLAHLRLASLASCTAMGGPAPWSVRAERRLTALLAAHEDRLDDAFWLWLCRSARDASRPRLVRRLLLGRDELKLPAERVWRYLQTLRWTTIPFDPLPADELLGHLLALVAELRDPASLAAALREIDGWREHPAVAAAIAPVAYARWARLLLPAKPATGRPEVDLALELRAGAYDAAFGDAEAVGRWYRTAGEFELLPPARQRDILPSGSYRELWSLVLARHPDAEEAARQEERHQRRRSGRSRTTTLREDEPFEPA